MPRGVFVHKKHSPATLVKMRAAAKRNRVNPDSIYNTPEFKAQHQAACLQAQNRPEVKAKKSVVSKEVQNRDEVKQKKSLITKQNRADPNSTYNTDEYKLYHKQVCNQPEIKRVKASHRGVANNKGKSGIEETFVFSLIQEITPLFKNMSPRKFRLGRRYPDFVCVERKLVIEYFGGWWHSEEVTGVSCEEHEQERVEYFRRYGGWDTLVLWYWELEDIPAMLQRIRRFIGIRDVESREHQNE